MTSKHEQFAYRLTQILTKLNTGQRLDANQLAEEFGVSLRTIQRDLNERLGFLEWHEQGPNYYSLDKKKLGHLYPEDIERFARFCSIQDLLPKIDQRFYQEQLTQSVRVRGIAYESIEGKQDNFNLLQRAIEQHQLIDFHYRKAGAEKGKYYNRMEPYALVNRLGVWYLMGIHEDKQKTFCFTQMNAIQMLTETFDFNPELQERFHNSDSVAHGNQHNEIIIQVSFKAAPFFLRRNLLPNQELVRKLDDGGLLLACKHVHEKEVVPIVRYWIPDLKIVSPAELQSEMVSELREYVDGC